MDSIERLAKAGFYRNWPEECVGQAFRRTRGRSPDQTFQEGPEMEQEQEAKPEAA